MFSYLKWNSLLDNSYDNCILFEDGKKLLVTKSTEQLIKNNIINNNDTILKNDNIEIIYTGISLIDMKWNACNKNKILELLNNFKKGFKFSNKHCENYWMDKNNFTKKSLLEQFIDELNELKNKEIWFQKSYQLIEPNQIKIINN